MTRPFHAPLAALLLLAGCSDEPISPPDSAPALEAAAPADEARPPAAVRETVYVPVYSHIYFQDEAREVDLAATLSIRNTDPEHAITITAVEYYDSAGRLVRRYGDGPDPLTPLASRAHVVGERDRTGGVGANFLVVWESASRVSRPVIEAVMISTAGTQGISFVSRGRVVRPLGDGTETTSTAE